MRVCLIAVVLCLVALQPVVAQVDGLFENYKKVKDSQRQGYLSEKGRLWKEYRKKNIQYARSLMEDPWRNVKLTPPADVHIEPEQPPVVLDTTQPPAPQENRDFTPEAPVIVVEVPQQPLPEYEIVEIEEPAPQYDTFLFYGTPLAVRWGGVASFRLKEVSAKGCAAAFMQLTDSAYSNLYADCLRLRDEYQLCDWAFLDMVRTLSEAACGRGTNEAVMLQGVILNQIGYKVRFAIDHKGARLRLLGMFDADMMRRVCVIRDDETYYFIDGGDETVEMTYELDVSEASYKGEKAISLVIDRLPRLAEQPTPDRLLASDDTPLKASVSLNQNLLDFMDGYPRLPYHDNDPLTRFVYFGNAPLSEAISSKLYPALRQKVSGFGQLQAANLLIGWLQMAFEYAYDDEVWGYDRAFFAEESLFYPFCDCEDRSILYAHLVRDLLGLDVVLIAYPGHLSTAVRFTDEVKGDAIMVDGQRYVVADPTYIGADVGLTASCYDNNTVKVIRLNQ